MKNIKNYVLDTNVLINDPSAIYKFQENDVYIPIYVLEEIDGLKNDVAERGHAAREVSRNLDALRGKGSFKDGVKIPEESSGNLFIYTPEKFAELPVAIENKMDHCILQSALDIKSKNPDCKTILVTMDINLRVRAEAMGISAEPYEYQSVDINSLDNNIIDISVSDSVLTEFYEKGKVAIDQCENLFINAPVMIQSPSGGTALGRIGSRGKSLYLNKLNIPKNIFGLKPRNRAQQIAIDFLLDDSVKFVTLMGTAGSGKSILAIATALHSIFDLKLYSKLLVSRPVVPMGRDIGFLPGSVDEKMRPFMQPIYDNIEYLLMSSGAKKKYNIDSCDSLFEHNIIEIEPLVYIRGRSIINQIMIVDEAQSLTQHEVKTIISRCGENTKIIFTGDIDQIDNPYVSKRSNGLTSAVKKIRDNPLVGHIMLEKGERSVLANLAVENL